MMGRHESSLAHRIARVIRSGRGLAVAAIAITATVAMTSASYALDAPVVVSNQNAIEPGNLSTFNQLDKVGNFVPTKTKNISPTRVLNGANILFLGSISVPAQFEQQGVTLNPTNGPGAFNTDWVMSDLDFFGGANPGIIAGLIQSTPNNGFALAGLLSVEASFPVGEGSSPFAEVPVAFPQNLAVSLQDIDSTVSELGFTTPQGFGDMFSTNFTTNGVMGASLSAAGSVVHWPPAAGTVQGSLSNLQFLENALGLFPDVFGLGFDAPIILEDATTSLTGGTLGFLGAPWACTGKTVEDPFHSTDLVGPMGIGLDSSGDIWVVNHGFPPNINVSYITEYPPGSFGCQNPINVIGFGTLVAGAFLAIDGSDDLWVTDPGQNAVFEFAPDGAVLTQIQGKKTLLKFPLGIALDGATNVYVASDANNAGRVIEFEGAESGSLLNIHPQRQIFGSKTGLNLPVGLATLPFHTD